MGDDASVQARPRLSPAVPIGPGGGAPLGSLKASPSPPMTALGPGAVHRFPRTRGDGGAASPLSATPPGTALVRKKSHHPDLRADADGAADRERREMLVLPGNAHVAGLGHKMELIHLNRTCTSVNLASAAAAQGLGHSLSPRLRCSSHTNLTDEEKMHRVRHQVSLAQGVGLAGSPALPCEDLASALRRRALAEDREDPVDPADDSDQDDDRSSVNTDELEEDSFLDVSSRFSPDADVDYLAVRPSLASTQLNEANGVRGPN